jgi:hypothetical protein
MSGGLAEPASEFIGDHRLGQGPGPLAFGVAAVASLLAIEMDTEAERQYLRRLAHGLGWTRAWCAACTSAWGWITRSQIAGPSES